jgi:hypothetical protein
MTDPIILQDDDIGSDYPVAPQWQFSFTPREFLKLTCAAFVEEDLKDFIDEEHRVATSRPGFSDYLRAKIDGWELINLNDELGYKSTSSASKALLDKGERKTNKAAST